MPEIRPFLVIGLRVPKTSSVLARADEVIE
jgi:hypothetical protein